MYDRVKILLKNLADLYINNKKKLYCAFIDYSKAFDSVWRKGLWYKLLKKGITGKIFDIVYNMYQNIKSCVASVGKLSDFFVSNLYGTGRIGQRSDHFENENSNPEVLE